MKTFSLGLKLSTLVALLATPLLSSAIPVGSNSDALTTAQSATDSGVVFQSALRRVIDMENSDAEVVATADKAGSTQSLRKRAEGELTPEQEAAVRSGMGDGNIGDLRHVAGAFESPAAGVEPASTVFGDLEASVREAIRLAGGDI